MDMRMPGMDGLEAVQRLRGIEALARIPIIAVSASAFEADRRQALAAGADDFIGKPFREFEMLERVRAVLGIEYVYLASASGEPPESGGPGEALVGGDREVLPTEIAERLRQAARGANYDCIIEILDGMGGAYPQSAAALREMMERFDYAALLERIGTRGEP
jgi:DNA-binding NarL/FixJ family response regulator